MVWGAISYQQRLYLVVLDGRTNSTKYCDVLQHYLLPVVDDIYGEKWIFQQDFCALHQSNYTKQWFEANYVAVMEWPAKSPDLNIIENVWAQIERSVYLNGLQFNSVSELEIAIFDAWDEIGREYTRNLYSSLPRLIEVLDRLGDLFSY